MLSWCASARSAEGPVVRLDGRNAIRIYKGRSSLMRLTTDDIVRMHRGLHVADDEISREAYTDEDLPLDGTAHLPRSIYCPISRLPMKDPVMCADGHTYERNAITEWLKRSKTSPTTGEELVHLFLSPNHSLRATISELICTRRCFDAQPPESAPAEGPTFQTRPPSQ